MAEVEFDRIEAGFGVESHRDECSAPTFSMFNHR